MKLFSIIFLFFAALSSCSNGLNIFTPIISDTTPSSIDAPDIDSSFRFGTFNAQFLVTPAPLSLCCADLSAEERVDAIAAAILRSDYDVLVIQEAFDDAIQDGLIEKVKGRYPHFVKYIDQGLFQHLEVHPTGIKSITDTRGFAINTFISEAELDSLIAGRLHPMDSTINLSPIDDGCDVPDTAGLFGDHCQDSGLMIISRFPFVELPDKSWVPEDGDVIAESAGAVWRDVAFMEHPVCEQTTEDCLAHKGTALVRVQHPNQSIYSVMFTHMEATGHIDISRKVRRHQLIMAEKLLTDSLNADLDEITDIIIFAGDFNINGDFQEMDRETIEEENEWEAHFSLRGSGEWQTYFSWMHDVIEWDKYPNNMDNEFKDRFLTKNAMQPGSRIDHVLVKGDVCIQQSTLGYNLYDHGPAYETGFGVGGQRTMSDHIGVNVDINLNFNRCSGHASMRLQGSDFENAAGSTIIIDDDETQLISAGAMQWYYLEEPGTYSIYLDGLAGAKYQVYSTRETTKTLSPYHGESKEIMVGDDNPLVADTFAAPDTPLFIKVFHPDRSVKGSYRLIVHRHACTSPEDECVLFPNVASSYPLADSNGDAIQFLYFRVDTDAPFNGDAQTLWFIASEREADINGELGPSGDYWTSLSEPETGVRVDSGGAAIRRENNEDNHQRYRFRVHNHSSRLEDVFVQWKTNLRVINFEHILAEEETDNFWNGDVDDDVLFQARINSEEVFLVGKRPNLGDFKENTAKSLASALRCPIGFLVSDDERTADIFIELEEEDTGGNDFLNGSIEFKLGINQPVNVLEVDDGVGHYSIRYAIDNGSHSMASHSGIRNNGNIVCRNRVPVEDFDNNGVDDSIDLGGLNFSDGAVGLFGNTKGKATNPGRRDLNIADVFNDPDTSVNDGFRVVVGSGTEDVILEIESIDGTACDDGVVTFGRSESPLERVISCN